MSKNKGSHLSWEQRKQELFDYLKQYEDALTPTPYNSVKQTIATLALEDIFISHGKIDRLVEIALGKISVADSVKETKNITHIAA